MLAETDNGSGRIRRKGGTHPICKICGCSDKFDFNVPDEIWKQVVPIGNQQDVVCLECFDELAFKKGVEYSDSIVTLYFAGNQAVFEFQTVSAQDRYAQIPWRRLTSHSLHICPVPGADGCSTKFFSGH